MDYQFEKGAGIRTNPDEHRPWARHQMDAELILDPHSDLADDYWRQFLPQFSSMQVVFERFESENEKRPSQLTWEYSDRIVQFDKEKHRSAWAAAKASGAKPKTALFLEQYLTEYYAYPVRLWEVKCKENMYGEPIRAYGYEEVSR